MKGLVIRSPWIDLILDGKKTWEMRSTRTAIRGEIALIKARSGMVYGTAELIDSLAPLSATEMHRTVGLHGIPIAQIEDAMRNRWTAPWVLRNVCRLKSPVPYEHTNGAVTWVNLSDAVAEAVRSGTLSTSDAQGTSRSSFADVTFTRSPLAPTFHPRSTAPCEPASGAHVDIPLTDANIRHGHIYLRSAERLLPTDCIGGSNKAASGRPIHIRFSPGQAIDTDVAGDKMIFRVRGPVRDFFERTGAKGGDTARLTRVADRSFTLAIVR